MRGIVAVNTVALFLLLPQINARTGCDSLDRAQVRYAKGFQVVYHDGYKVVRTFASAPSRRLRRPTSTNVLVPRGCALPKLTGELASARVVRTPVNRLATTNEGDVAMLRMLGLSDRIVAVAGRSAYPEIAARQAKGEVRSIGHSAAVNLEVVLALEPELLVILSQGRKQQARLDEAAALGISVLPDHAWLEATPLGYAEWIKALAVFFDREAQAERIFGDISASYSATAARSKKVSKRAKAVFATPTPSGNWHVDRNGKGSRLLEDAGAANLLADDGPTHSVPVAEERLLQMSQGAEFWISDDHGEAWDAVLSRPPYDRGIAGRVYDPFRVLPEIGRHDYYGSGLARPDLLLADIQHIFYPQLRPDHKLIYLRKRPPSE